MEELGGFGETLTTGTVGHRGKALLGKRGILSGETPLRAPSLFLGLQPCLGGNSHTVPTGCPVCNSVDMFKTQLLIFCVSPPLSHSQQKFLSHPEFPLLCFV